VWNSFKSQVVYQRILQLTYVEELLETVKTLFVQLFEPFLVAFVTSLHAVNTGKAVAVEAAKSWNFREVFEKWDKVFYKVLQGLELKHAKASLHRHLKNFAHLVAQDRHARHRPSSQQSVVEPNLPPDDMSTGKRLKSPTDYLELRPLR
jgi:signal recognition particle receptor subunit alpha